MKFFPKNPVTPEQIDFKNLALPASPNHFLLVPAGFASIISTPESPLFDYPVEELEMAWKRMIKNQPRVTLRSYSEKKRRYHYIQKGVILQLPDYVIVQFIPVFAQQSTIAMFSYSVYGYSDFGLNRTRVFKWLIALKKELVKSHPQEP